MKAGSSFLVLRDQEPVRTREERWISGSSYEYHELFHTLTVPTAEISESDNPFDVVARRRAKAARARLQAAIRKTVEVLRKQKPPSARRTDIDGFVAAAMDGFAEKGDGYEKWLYLATDLQDNVRRKLTLSLPEVNVVVYAFQTSPDPNVTARLKDRWRKRFEEAGAASVTFRTAEVIRP